MTAVVVVLPVYRNEATLEPLVDRLAAALAGVDWRVRMVVDASPDGSARVAAALALREPRVACTLLTANVGQHAALTRGLADEPGADAWVCMDADLQDPPEAVPALLGRLAGGLAGGDVDAVFAGRRGAYECRRRRWAGAAHRRLLSMVSGAPADAGAFVAMGPSARAAVLAAGAPSPAAALAAAGLRLTSQPVRRSERPVGASAWTGRARLAFSLRTLAWALRHRPGA